jgi:outer membrane protein OmpA-like peptidoglycan-associated protein
VVQRAYECLRLLGGLWSGLRRHSLAGSLGRAGYGDSPDGRGAIFSPFDMVSADGAGIISARRGHRRRKGRKTEEDKMSYLKTTGVVLLTSLWLGACATEDYVNKHVAVVQDQVTADQGKLNDHDQRLSHLDQTTREALERAEAAGKLAEGKFMYSMVMSDDSAHFPVNGSDLSTDETARLSDFANKLKSDNKNVYLEIQGYTDSTGGPRYNLRLGQDRAEAVRRYLSMQGVALNRMSTISYGQDNPAAPNNSRAGRAQNRRVVVVVLD